MARKPSVKTNCVANTYTGPGERIIEFSHGGIGGLISFKETDDGRLRVEVYRCDDRIDLIVDEQRLHPHLKRRLRIPFANPKVLRAQAEAMRESAYHKRHGYPVEAGQERALAASFEQMASLEDIAAAASKPEFYECGICGHLHQADWNGDCREDANRFTNEQVEVRFGREGEGWVEVPMPGGEETIVIPETCPECGHKDSVLAGRTDEGAYLYCVDCDWQAA